MLTRRHFLVVTLAFAACKGGDAGGDVDPTPAPTPPTPDRLRTLEATDGAPITRTFIFCSPCKKVTVTLRVSHSGTEPVSIRFKAQPRPGAAEKPECQCDESGWVQFVKEAGWEFDNAMEPRWKKVIGSDDVPGTTPSGKEEETEDGTRVVPLDPWYGEDPTKPRDEITDTPGLGQEKVTNGPHAGARRKQFVTRYVCRKGREDGTWEDGAHSFELRWTIYHNAEAGWTRVTLEGTRPTQLASPDAACPGDG